MKRLNLIIISVMMILTLTYQTSITQNQESTVIVDHVSSKTDSTEKKVNYLKPKLESFNLVDSVNHYKLLIDTLRERAKENLITLKKQQIKLEDVIDTARTMQILSLH